MGQFLVPRLPLTDFFLLMTQASCGRHLNKGRRVLWVCQSTFKAGTRKSVHVLAIRASVSWMRTYRKMIERSSWICRQRCMHLVCVIEVGGGNERVTTRRKRVWSTRNIRTSLSCHRHQHTLRPALLSADGNCNEIYLFHKQPTHAKMVLRWDLSLGISKELSYYCPGASSWPFLKLNPHDGLSMLHLLSFPCISRPREIRLYQYVIYLMSLWFLPSAVYGLLIGFRRRYVASQFLTLNHSQRAVPLMSARYDSIHLRNPNYRICTGFHSSSRNQRRQSIIRRQLRPLSLVWFR